QQQGEWEAALDAMNALYRDFDSLNDFEKVTLLNFYTNTLLRLEMWQESITAFSQMLEVPDLRPDLGARALMALGQLHARIGEHDRAVVYYQSFLDATAGMNNMDEQRATVTRLLAEANRATQ